MLLLVAVPFEHREQALGTDGLLDIVLEPELLRLLDHATRARHHDHGKRRERLVTQLLRAEPPAVLHGHHQVEEDDAGGKPPAKLIESDLPVLGNRHLVTLYLKPAGYGVTAVAIILDDQHAMMMREPHPRPPGPSRRWMTPSDPARIARARWARNTVVWASSSAAASREQLHVLTSTSRRVLVGC